MNKRIRNNEKIAKKNSHLGAYNMEIIIATIIITYSK